MSVTGGFRLSGRFVLNGNFNADGVADIRSSSAPGQQEADFIGDGNLNNPHIDIQFNAAGFDRLASILRAAHTIEVSFTTSRELTGTVGVQRLVSFDISARRRFE